jgi:hypothetical protein
MKAICLFVMKASSILPALFLALSLGGATNIQAQGWQVGGYFTAVSPRGEFSENVTNNGYGGGGVFLKRLGPSPLLVGLDAGGVIYGSDTHLEPLSTTIPNVFVRVRTSNKILLAHFLTRLQTRKGGVRPYADGLIGLKHLYTTTTITSDFSNEPLAGVTDLSDTSFSYGFGGGLQIPLAGGESGIMLDGNIRYLRGGRAVYLKKGSIREVDGVTIFDVLSSRTDVITFQIGITFRF